MTVFRAVETWLAARREEMAKEGENFLRSSKLEYWILEYWNMNLKWRLRSSENTGYWNIARWIWNLDWAPIGILQHGLMTFRWREHWGSHGEAHHPSIGTCQVDIFGLHSPKLNILTSSVTIFLSNCFFQGSQWCAPPSWRTCSSPPSPPTTCPSWWAGCKPPWATTGFAVLHENNRILDQNSRVVLNHPDKRPFASHTNRISETSNFIFSILISHPQTFLALEILLSPLPSCWSTKTGTGCSRQGSTLKTSSAAG